MSVVIPLYNKRGYVHAAVNSVLAQTHPKFELIVVDDGSTDGSADELADFDDPRLRLVSQANAGVAAARNRGIAEARHGWVALLDADDRWRPEHLAELGKIIAERPDAGLIATTVQQVRGGRLLDSDSAAPRRIRAIDYFAEAAINILIVHTSATALRRDVALAIEGFRDLRPGQDIDCWSRVALRWPVVVSNCQTAFYLRDTGGAMTRWAAQTRRTEGFTSLQRFGGSVQSLADALATGQYESRRPGIEAYIDARILSGARKCLAAGDTGGARQRLRFVHRTSREYVTYRMLAAIPQWVFPAGVGMFRRLRRR